MDATNIVLWYKLEPVYKNMAGRFACNIKNSGVENPSFCQGGHTHICVNAGVLKPTFSPKTIHVIPFVTGVLKTPVEIPSLPRSFACKLEQRCVETHLLTNAALEAGC